MSTIDFGRCSDDYARHRPGFPPSFYDRIEAFMRLAGKNVLDLGTGPAVMAIEIAKRGATVTGIDISENQIELARRRTREVGLDRNCTFLVGSAEETGLAAQSFDMAVAGQCWHWFDGPKALSEIRRLLKPFGLLVIAHYSYLAAHCEIAHATEELILRHNPTWTMANSSGIFPEQIDEVIHGGFELVEQFCYECDQEFTHESWRGRMRTCNGVGSRQVGGDAVSAFDEDLKTMLTARFPEPLRIKHRVWCVLARQPE